MSKVKLSVESYKNTITPDTSKAKVVVLDDNGKPKVSPTTNTIITKYPDLLDANNQKVYSNNIQVIFIPNEGAVVPKLLSKANIQSMVQEFSNNYNKDLKHKPNSTYTLKKSNIFEYVDKETGEVTQRISAIFTPTFTPIKSSLSF
tara:strand:- start:1748 stop:2185 length:438 start_codon:yes stop_codon:yes gene_type:complete